MRLAWLVVAGCARAVPAAPPGTPPLAVEIASPIVTDVLSIAVCWDAACGERLAVRASCVPGPCAIVDRDRRGEHAIAFGAGGKHALTIVASNGKHEKSWTTEIEVVVADAIRLGCSTWEGGTQRPCLGRSYPPGTTFSFTADAFAGGAMLPDKPAIETTFTRYSDGRWQAETPGTYLVHASYDGLVADLSIVVEP